MSYEIRMVSALTGLTVGQLSHWWETGIFVPEYSLGESRVYSFRDLIALRTYAKLRGERSAGCIREVLPKSEEFGDTEQLTAYRFVLRGKSGIRLMRWHGRETVEPIDPGTRVVTFDEVIKPFLVDDLEVPHMLRPREHITVRREVCGGNPVIKGTRIEHDLVADLVNWLPNPEDVADFYSQVSAAAARDAADFDRYVERAAHRETLQRRAA